MNEHWSIGVEIVNEEVHTLERMIIRLKIHRIVDL